MTLKEKYKNADPVGYYACYSPLALVILDIDDETATAAYRYNGTNENIGRHKIYYTYTGRAYIRKNGRRYYFDQIMRMGGF